MRRQEMTRAWDPSEEGEGHKEVVSIRGWLKCEVRFFLLALRFGDNGGPDQTNW